MNEYLTLLSRKTEELDVDGSLERARYPQAQAADEELLVLLQHSRHRPPKR
jgi:hypothetical protein